MQFINRENHMRKMLILLAALLLAGCSGDKNAADAYGNFEATEVIISSEANGKLLSFDATEGETLDAGAVVGLIDTTLIALQKRELLAQDEAIKSQLAGAEAQIAMTRQKLDNLQIDLTRAENMLKDDAATQKQLDDLAGTKKIFKKQMAAARASRDAVAAQLKALDAKQALIDEQLARCRIINPIDGTVLETYVEPFEMTAVGRPLYKIADLTMMTLKVYAPGSELHRIQLGAPCTVRIDNGKKYLDYSGRIAWISGKAEFTPKIIQTKEERVNLVYAVKIDVPNDGAVKIGMPGEVIFNKADK